MAETRFTRRRRDRNHREYCVSANFRAFPPADRHLKELTCRPRASVPTSISFFTAIYACLVSFARDILLFDRCTALLYIIMTCVFVAHVYANCQKYPTK